MKRSMMALGMFAIMAAACKPVTLDGGGGGSDGVGGADDGAVAVRHVMAIHVRDMPAQSLDLASSCTSPIDPDALVLVLTSSPRPCSAPLLPVGGPSSQYWHDEDGACVEPAPYLEVAYFIPPALLGAGPVDLDNPGVQSYSAYLNDCGEVWGAAAIQALSCGSPEINSPAGTLTLDDSDPDALELTLSGGIMAAGDIPLDGTYDVVTCP